MKDRPDSEADELQNARRMLQRDRIDPIWRGTDHEALARTRTYRFLASLLGIEAHDCQPGLFTLQECRDAWGVLAGITYADVRTWAITAREPAKPGTGGE